MYKILLSKRYKKLLLILFWTIFVILCAKIISPKSRNLVNDDLGFYGNRQIISLNDVNSRNLTKEEYYIELAKCMYKKETTIPGYMLTNIRKLVENDESSLPECSNQGNRGKSRRNFAFLNLHYTNGETVSNILRRYSLKHNLSVVLPMRDKITLGWPHQPEPIVHRPTKTGYFNSMMDYVIYNKSYIHSMMPDDTVFITMVRYPVNRLVPVLKDYMEVECSYMPASILTAEDAAKEFIKNKIKYDSIYSSVENMYMKKNCVCFYGVSFIQNAMAFDLGFPTGYHMKPPKQTNNYAYITEWLESITKNVPVIMIAEHLDLSLIMLKKYMCWTNKDIMYVDFRQDENDQNLFSRDDIEDFSHWSNVDSLLYLYLNKTFWSRVDKIGADDLLKEAQEFTQQRNKITTFCKDVIIEDKNVGTLTIPETESEKSYQIVPTECASLVATAQNMLLQKLKVQYNEWSSDNVKTPVDTNKGRFHHTWC